MKLPDFEAWAVFASVVEHRSFSGAADALGDLKRVPEHRYREAEMLFG